MRCLETFIRCYICSMCNQDSKYSCNVNCKMDVAMSNSKKKLDIANRQECVYWYIGIFLHICHYYL